jgi:HemX protein
MSTLLTLLTILLPIGYLLVWADYLWLFYTDDMRARRTCSRLAAAVVLLHMTVMIVRAVGLHRLPMGTQSEFMGALALAILGTYLVVERRFRAKGTGFLTTGAAAAVMLLASLAGPGTANTSPLLKDPGFAGHAVLVLLAYTALSLSFLYAILYLVLARQLMRRRFGLLFRRLPALETLERMSVVSVEMGVPLMFLALSLGHLWMYSLADRVDAQTAKALTPWDPKILFSWVIFLAYTVGLLGHRFWGWRGRRMNILAVAAFVFIVLGMGASHHFFPTFHNFPTLDAAASREAR